MLVLLFGLIIIFIIFRKSIIIVKKGEVCILERLGRYRMTATEGLTIVIPIMDKVRATISLKDTTYDFKVENVITKDRKKVDINTSIMIRIEDPVKACYEITSVQKGLEYIITTTLFGEVSTLLYNDLFLERTALLASIKEQLAVSEEAWGFITLDVSIKDINLKIN